MRWKTLMVIVSINIVTGVLFGLVMPDADLRNMLIGGCIGAVISFVLSYYNLFFTPRYLNHIRLLPKLALDYFIYIVTIVGLITFFFLFFNIIPGLTLGNIRSNIIFQMTLIFSAFLTFIFIVYNLINALLGKGTLSRMLLGFYHRPREEERIFLFLDVKGSTAIAEQIGHLKFLSLLDDIFFDISETILLTGGEIYKYVGDEAIITWKLRDGVKNANCLMCHLYIQEKLSQESRKYRDRYGVTPVLKGGVHGGTAVVGEMGLLKKEIAYLGDVLNTTAHIEGECNALGESFLVSGDMLKLIQLPDDVDAVSHGLRTLRGKKQPVELFGIRRK